MLTGLCSWNRGNWLLNDGLTTRGRLLMTFWISDLVIVVVLWRCSNLWNCSIVFRLD